jgi:hypothetical protein
MQGKRLGINEKAAAEKAGEQTKKRYQRNFKQIEGTGREQDP